MAANHNHLVVESASDPNLRLMRSKSAEERQPKVYYMEETSMHRCAGRAVYRGIDFLLFFATLRCTSSQLAEHAD